MEIKKVPPHRGGENYRQKVGGVVIAWKYSHIATAPSDLTIVRPPPSTKEDYKKKFPLVEGDTCEAGWGVLAMRTL